MQAKKKNVEPNNKISPSDTVCNRPSSESIQKKNDAIINSHSNKDQQKKLPKGNETGNKKLEAVEKSAEKSRFQKDKFDSNKPGENQTANEAISKAEEKERRRREWEAKLKEQGKDVSNEKESKEGVNKAELRAKRREQQEAQRQAKAAAKVPAVTPTPAKPKLEAVKSPPPSKKEAKSKIVAVGKVQLVHHLYSDDTKKYDNESCVSSIRGVHPAFRKLGVQYASNVVLGSNARCLALLAALKELIDDLSTPPKQEFCRYLESTLQHCVAYLQHCRPFAVSMTNALRHFKLHLTQIDTNLPDNEKKAKLIDVVDTYFHDDISKAGEAISMRVNEKICNGDVILTYGW